MVVWYNRVVIGVGPLSVRFRSLHVSVAKTEPKLCPISSLRPNRLYLKSSTNSFPNKVTFEKDKNPASRRPPAAGGVVFKSLNVDRLVGCELAFFTT